MYESRGQTHELRLSVVRLLQARPEGARQVVGAAGRPAKLRQAETVLNRFKARDRQPHIQPGGRAPIPRIRAAVQRVRQGVADALCRGASADIEFTDVDARLSWSELRRSRPLEHFAGAPLQIERWLNQAQKDRKWSDNTWNRYYELLDSVFNRAVKWKTGGVSRMAVNPMPAIEKRTGSKKKFETRLEEDAKRR